MSLGMAWNATRTTSVAPSEEDIGVMSEVPVAAPATQAPAASGDVPVIPAAPAPQAKPAEVVPAAPVESTEAEPAAPATAESDEKGSQEG
jgi:preprotein translocase subunit SecG